VISSDRPKLTQFSPAGGCGCKLGPEELRRLLSAMPNRVGHHDVLADFRGMADAAVLGTPDGRRLVFTLDFFTPVVDDARDWGAIAAANALSDVFATGASPAIALSIAAWPAPSVLPLELLQEVMLGAEETLVDTGAVLVGGHTIRDHGPLFGLAVIGFASANELMSNANGRVGDQLILTKALGMGVLSTALKNERLAADALKLMTNTMKGTNQLASRIAVAHGVRTATDVSGFGLLGHLHELASASELGAVVHNAAVPYLAAAKSLAEKGAQTSGGARNDAFLDPFISYDYDAPQWSRILGSDPQSSGGLLLAVSQAHANAVLADLIAQGVPARRIGELTDGIPVGHIRVRDEVGP
jgi:selenide,water dikinase